MNKIKVYQPQYYRYFSCSGSACKFNCCCFGWNIDIDKKTYDKYMDLDDDVKNEILEKLVLVDDGQRGAKPLLDSNGDCSFLNEKGLCSLQLKLGFEYLGEVCWYYPRIFCQVGGSFERFLELSCEEAAKLILFDKGYMNFEELEPELDPYNPGEPKFNFQIDTEKYTKSKNAIDIFWKLRVTTVAILQSRQYKIGFRMHILYLFMQEITELFNAGRDEEISLRADDFMTKIDKNYYSESAVAMPYGADRDFIVIIDILKEMYSKGWLLFNQSVDQTIKGFDMQPDAWILPDDINEKFRKYYEMFLTDKEYIFENYLVHRVLSEAFPFNYRGAGDVMSNYVDMLARYNIIEFLFTGICRSYMRFDRRRIIDCIALFTRSYDHSKAKLFDLKSYKIL